MATSGTVSLQHDPSGARYYVLADRAHNLVGLKPGSRAARYRGRRVAVTGRFDVAPSFGREIHLTRIRPR